MRIADSTLKLLTENARGLEKGRLWAGILAAHIRGSFSGNEKAKALLSIPFLADAPLFSNDILEGLSFAEISLVYEHTLSIFDTKSKAENGQFFTPDDVCQFMARQSSSFPDGVWLDPCCGIGNLSFHLTKAQKDPEGFALRRLVMNDRDEVALEIAKVLFALHFQDKVQDFYGQFSKNVVCSDFLKPGNGSTLPPHDFAILNPPYLAVPADSSFESSKAANLYAYFLERVAKTSKGFVSVNPCSFLFSGRYLALRNILLDKYSGMKSFNFDIIPGYLFPAHKLCKSIESQANNTRATIFVAGNHFDGTFSSDFLRWKAAGREKMLSAGDSLLAEVPFSSDVFPKVGDSALAAHYSAAVKGWKALREFVDEAGPFSLDVPATPKYFISATQKTLNRASSKTLRFATEEKMDIAYALINSAAMYWWWRVVDGGMSLSLETLLSCPVPPHLEQGSGDPAFQAVVKRLKDSEEKNVVVKMNAGMACQNVKHDADTLKAADSFVCGEGYRRFAKYRANDYFAAGW